SHWSSAEFFWPPVSLCLSPLIGPNFLPPFDSPSYSSWSPCSMREVLLAPTNSPRSQLPFTPLAPRRLAQESFSPDKFSTSRKIGRQASCSGQSGLRSVIGFFAAGRKPRWSHFSFRHGSSANGKSRPRDFQTWAGRSLSGSLPLLWRISLHVSPTRTAPFASLSFGLA